VTDFVRWRIHAHLWPIFNIADAVLLVGAALLLVDAARASRRIAPGSAAAVGRPRDRVLRRSHLFADRAGCS
jgi:lipoprotein signal peptidase